MDKVVTKIGDCIIERKVSKPPDQAAGKVTAPAKGHGQLPGTAKRPGHQAGSFRGPQQQLGMPRGQAPRRPNEIIRLPVGGSRAGHRPNAAVRTMRPQFPRGISIMPVRARPPVQPPPKQKNVLPPDISKYAGISIQRRTKQNSMDPLQIPGIQAQRIQQPLPIQAEAVYGEEYDDHEEVQLDDDYEDEVEDYGAYQRSGPKKSDGAGDRKQGIDAWNLPGVNVQRWGNQAAATANSPVHISSEDDEKKGEDDEEDDGKDGEDEDDFGENERFEDETVDPPKQGGFKTQKTTGLPSIPGITFEKKSTEGKNKQFQNKSPIVLSSEDDEKVEDEEFPTGVEDKETGSGSTPSLPSLPAGVTLQQKQQDPGSSEELIDDDPLLADEEEEEEEEEEDYEMAEEEPKPIPKQVVLPNIPGIKIEKKGGNATPDKLPTGKPGFQKQQPQDLESSEEFAEDELLGEEEEEEDDEEYEEDGDFEMAEKTARIKPMQKQTASVPGISAHAGNPSQPRFSDSKRDLESSDEMIEDDQLGEEEEDLEDEEMIENVEETTTKPPLNLPNIPGISIEKKGNITLERLAQSGIAVQVKKNKEPDSKRLVEDSETHEDDLPLDEDEDLCEVDEGEDETEAENAYGNEDKTAVDDTNENKTDDNLETAEFDTDKMDTEKDGDELNAESFDKEDALEDMKQSPSMQEEGDAVGASNLDEDDGENKADEEGKEPMWEDDSGTVVKTEPNIDDDCNDLMEMMKKGEIEGEIEDDKEEDDDDDDDDDGDGEGEGEETETTEEQPEGKKKKKKGKGKRKAKTDGEEEGEEGKKRKKKKKSKKDDGTEEGKKEGESSEEDDEEEGDDPNKDIDKSKVTSANLRKNIREVMDETKLDESTLAAQRQEAERLKRLQDQQKIIREVQRQLQQSRQNQKTQNKMLSLLQGNTQTSILKTSSLAPQTSTHVKVPNHVLVKLSNGQQTSLNNKKMMELLKSTNKTVVGKPQISKTLLKQGMVTPSVSIAPVVKKELLADDKKKKKGDVVTLSSDSEDDCIVLSEEEESEPDEDPTNSGMHTCDKYNIPDEQGRIIVNVAHPEGETDLYLAPQITRIIKPHQVGGIRFLYDNVIESMERFQTSTGFGCILAHSMGLGKTLQLISFADIFLRHTPAKTILCIMPINTIQNWLSEFNMWLPKENKTELEVQCREFDIFVVNESLKNINTRAKVILEWYKNGGVLLMGYELFRLLSLKKSNRVSKKRRRTDAEEKEEDDKHKELVEEVYSALVKPGPDLVICDEGHRIKNSHATTSQALKQIRTKRRVVLTGYPLQNNLLEYWCMVDFVRPNYLGSKTEFSNMFERPIQNGQCIDSTPQDKRLMRYRAHVLHSLLEGFVQRRSHAVLQATLPEKEEYVLLLRFTEFQRKLYDTFMNEVVRTVAVPNPLKAFAVCCKIWNHPDVLFNFLRKKGEEIDLDLEEALPPGVLHPSNRYSFMPPPMSMNPINAMMPMPPMPPMNDQMNAPWPKKGPGSRGGRLRGPQAPKKPNARGKKPAASIPPNSDMNTDKSGMKQGMGVGGYPGYQGDSYSEARTLPGADSCYPPYGAEQRNFPTSGFNSDFDEAFQSGSNFAKSPLDTLEEMSSGGYPNRKFYQQANDNATQTPFANTDPLTGFDPEHAFQQNSDVPSSFDSSDSSFNQADSTKSFDFQSDFNSDYYNQNQNFQPQRAAGNFPTSNDSRTGAGSGFFQSQNYSSANAAGFNYQSGQASFGFQHQGSSYDSTGSFQTGSTQAGLAQSALAQAGLSQSGLPQSALTQSAMSQSGLTQSAMSQSGLTQSAMSQSGLTQSAMSQSGLTQSAMSQSGLTQSAMSQSGLTQSAMSQSGLTQSAMSQSGLTQSAMSQSRLTQSGLTQSGFHGSDYASQNTGDTGSFQASETGFGTSASNFSSSAGGSQYMQPQQSQQQQRGNYQQTYWTGSSWSTGPPCGYQDRSGHFPATSSSSTTSAVVPSAPVNTPAVQPPEEFVAQPKAEKEPQAAKTAEFGNTFNADSELKMETDKPASTPPATPVKKEETEEIKKEDIKKEDALPYDWAVELFKNYVTGIIENSSKMEVFFTIMTESVKMGDRLLVFSQSLLTLDLIEDYLHKYSVPNRDEKWARHRNYFRLDGSTPALEREKLINEFNINPNVHIFLVSTRAGSLGINLVGANRVVVFDASWNPCHDTQAVCRVYRYGQNKPCFVYRLVMDSCLEKKIYDRQINKQGMADRVVDELNPDAHLSIKEVTNLCWDDQEDTKVAEYAHLQDKYKDEIVKTLLVRYSKLLSKEPFQHESLLIDRKEKKLSQAEKRLAKRSYELEKQAANQPKNIYSFFPNQGGARNFGKPIASVRPMQSDLSSRISALSNRSKWIPAEVWQKQGMSAQEMTLPLDVVIPTNSPEKTSIVLKAGQRVMVLKSPKGIYMQLENGKIIAIRTAFKVGQGGKDDGKKDNSMLTTTLKNNPNVTITAKGGATMLRTGLKQPFMKPFVKPGMAKLPMNVNAARAKQQLMGKARPFVVNRKFQPVSADIKQKLLAGGADAVAASADKAQDSTETSSVGTSSDAEPPTTDDAAGEKSATPAAAAAAATADKPEEEKPPDEETVAGNLETLRKVTESIPLDNTTVQQHQPAEQEQASVPDIAMQQAPPMDLQLAAQAPPTEMQMSKAPTTELQMTQTPIPDLQRPMQSAATQQDEPKAADMEAATSEQQQLSSLKKYRHNFPSHMPVVKSSDDVVVKAKVGVEASQVGLPATSSQRGQTVKSDASLQQGSDSQDSQNVQNWLMNQSYPPMDPYGNYFPGYYGYGPGPAPMMPPYDGWNYAHGPPVGRNSPMVNTTAAKQEASVETPKITAQATPVPVQSSGSAPRNSPVLGYPPYPNPYPYPYNYPSNPGFNNQGYPPNFSNQQNTAANTTANTSTTSTAPVATPTVQQQNQHIPYDSSMYSAFHRPDSHFQTPENPYPPPFPRPPYPNSGTPGFYPYNPPYRPFPDPNYPYGHNFNPYMHPPGYGYPVQNPPSAGGSNQGSASAGDSSSVNTS